MSKLINEDPNLEIYNLEGGISAWSAAGCEIKTSGKFFLSLDRQVQLTIGLGVLIGNILGYFISPIFLLLSGFFGAGLIFAGLSGYCGLAILMAKMPWNKGCKKTSSCSIYFSIKYGHSLVSSLFVQTSKYQQHLPSLNNL
jgi:hypothetical protein